MAAKKEDAVATRTQDDATAAWMEKVIVGRDLSQLTPSERLSYYNAVCEQHGLKTVPPPFDYLNLGDKLVLYANKDCAAQLRGIHGVSFSQPHITYPQDLVVVTINGTDSSGRSDTEVAAVPVTKEGGEWKTASSGKRYFQGNGVFAPMNPEDRANALMKCLTKAKRRLTLSLAGLGLLDETEIETIPKARKVDVDLTTGEIAGKPPTPIAQPQEEYGRKDAEHDEVATIKAEPAANGQVVILPGAGPTPPEVLDGPVLSQTLAAVTQLAMDHDILPTKIIAYAAQTYGVATLQELSERQCRSIGRTLRSDPQYIADTHVV